MSEKSKAIEKPKPKRCGVCGRFLDKQGRCAKVDGGYFEPAEHW